MSTVTIIVAVVVAAVAAPLILLIFTSRQRRTDRATDMARQDQVADRAAEAARLLAENNQLVADTSSGISSQLDQIHTLVNSNMTAAMQAEYDAVCRELAMMIEVMEIKKAAGQQPSQEALDAAATTRSKLAELAVRLEDRAHAQDRADNQ